MVVSLFISEVVSQLTGYLQASGRIFAAGPKLGKKSSASSFTSSGISILRDERGVLEPHSDLVATALAVIGLVVLTVLLSRTYMGYEDSSFALENYESASLLAEYVAEAPDLQAENPGTLSASALDKFSGADGHDERMKFFAAFSGNYPFLVEVRTEDGRWQWLLEPDMVEPGFLMGKQEKVAASVPVVIELSPAESVPGTLTVVLYKTPWV
ncbi:hypothetical protein MSSAC_0869 [Methanosarcina siciliae C2J]|uniref:Uncharacterized protein n=1 Tax=Methanosarcina siciliae C2J TaxID=1434118 RepID=A0A0E3PM20_9EURY|nr:hypothetical protein MSSAC_0869 [Methanosarcina siciliae C2J]